MDLFDHQLIPLPLTEMRQSQITFWPNWLDGERADSLLSKSINDIDWRSDVIRIAGKTIPIPRLQQWFGNPKTSYTYSNIRLQAVAFPNWIDELREKIEVQSGESFNRALVNYYRDGSDSVDWHADDEAELGFEPLVASLSWVLSGSFNCATISLKNVSIFLCPTARYCLWGLVFRHTGSTE